MDTERQSVFVRPTIVSRVPQHLYFRHLRFCISQIFPFVFLQTLPQYLLHSTAVTLHSLSHHFNLKLPQLLQDMYYLIKGNTLISCHPQITVSPPPTHPPHPTHATGWRTKYTRVNLSQVLLLLENCTAQIYNSVQCNVLVYNPVVMFS